MKIRGKHGEYEYQIDGRSTLNNGDAYAILVDDGSGNNTYTMYFIRSQEEVSVGQKYKNKEIKYVYDGIEDENFSPYLSEWYGNRDKITSIIFDNIIKPQNTSQWFYYMKNCTSIDLTKLRTEEVKDMSQMFYYCEKITTLGDLSSWNTSKVENMDGLFEGCKKLTYIGKLNNWDTSKVYSFSSMFDYCENLTDIGDLSNWDTSNLGGTYSMFRGCEKLNYIGDLSNWNVSKVLNMSNMFHSCRNIKTLGDLSNWNTQKVWNMSSMFFDCIKLETLGDLSNWNTSNVKEMIWMFGMLHEKDTNHIINVDCSKWNVEKVTKYGCFNQYAPNVTPPNWVN